MASPKAYTHGYRINFEHPKGTRHQRRFRYDHYPNPKKAAQDYIDAILGGKPTGGHSIAKAVDYYLSWSERTGKKKSRTVQTDRQRLSIFLRWAEGEKIDSPRDLTLPAMRLFQDYFYENYPFYSGRRRHVKASISDKEIARRRNHTWVKYVWTISGFLNFCVEREWIETNIIRGRKEFRSKLQKTVPRWFSDEELHTLWDYFDRTGDPVVQTWFRFLPYTGLRVSEALNLKWDDVDLKEKVVRVTGDTKNYRNRTVPLNERLLPYLQKLACQSRRAHGGITEGDFVFANAKGSRYCSHRAWLKRLQASLSACKLKGGVLHSFRHTFGSALARAGAHPKQIQELMGHSTIDMAMQYSHFLQRHLRTPIDALPF